MNNLLPYGYFFDGSSYSNGLYIKLENGHDSDHRIKAQEEAGINKEFCALFYSKDGEKFLPFHYNSKNEETLVLNKTSDFAFWINYNDHSIIPDLDRVTHFLKLGKEDNFHAHFRFNTAKQWFTDNFGDFELTINGSEGEQSYFTIGIQVNATAEATYYTHHDLPGLIIHVFDELTPKD